RGRITLVIRSCRSLTLLTVKARQLSLGQPPDDRCPVLIIHARRFWEQMVDFYRIVGVHAARRFPLVAQDGTGLLEALHEVLEKALFHALTLCLRRRALPDDQAAVELLLGGLLERFADFGRDLHLALRVVA